MSLRLDSLDHRFGRQHALRDVSLHVRPGDCYGFVGHNGAGKTTALRIALGLLRPRQGRVVIDGVDAARHPREARVLTGGMIETPAFYRGVSGRANLVLLGRLQGLPRNEARLEADRLLELVGLRAEARKRFGVYSQGMRQRLGLAQALLGNPPYLVLDEPTNGLDPEGVADVRRLLQHLVRDEGRTVLISSHLLQELSGLCNRIGVLRQGRLLVEETMTELLDEEGSRYDVQTDDDDAAAEVLETLGLTTAGDERTAVDLGTREPGDVARALVEAGLALRAFAPRPPDLEEIYLRWSTRPGPSGPGSSRGANTGETIEITTPSRRAPSLPILRVLGHELRRSRGRVVLLGLPALVAGMAVARRHAEADEMTRQAAEEGYFSTTDVTAFESVGWALNAALPLLVVLAAGVASQVIAGERSRGTLRHLLLRPVRRLQLAAGKACAIAGVTLGAYLAVVLVSVLASAVAFDYADLTELLLTGEPMAVETATADLMWPRLRGVVAVPALSLCAYVGLGFLAGSLIRSAAGALAMALAAVVGLDLLRGPARGLGFDAWVPSSHLPSILGDASSYVRYYLDASQGASDAMFEYGRLTVVVPCLWCVATVGVACLVTAARTEQ